MHATQYLRTPHAAAPGALVVMHGAESHLKQSCLKELRTMILGAGDDNAIGESRFAGQDLEWWSVRDELLTVSMFTARRLVVVDDAEEFVTNCRSALEEYVEAPAKKSVLVLDVKSWRKNTRLAKKLDSIGLELDCGELKGTQLTGWLVEDAKTRFAKQLTRDAAALMVELAGNGLALLDQELQKLTSYVGNRDRINAEDVRTLVGGWKAETTWNMINAIRDQQPDVAFICLDKLLVAGEPAPKILGGMNFVFKKLAQATEISRHGTNLRVALKESGVQQWEIEHAERYLKRIRRQRAEHILERLALADYGLKGGSRLPDRLQLEQLVLWLMGAVEVG